MKKHFKKQYFKKQYIIEKIQYSIFKTTSEKPDINTNISELIDSLDAIEIVMSLEQIFNISINDDDIEKLGEKKIVNILDLFDALRKYDIYSIKEERLEKLKKINNEKC